MNSITEMLAQAVYGLNLNDLPLDNLASGPRPRSVSMVPRHPSTSSPHEIAASRLSSFSTISEAPVAGKKTPASASRPPERDLVDGGVARSRGPLVRAATQEEQGSPPLEMSMLKRHSTPVTTSSRPSLPASLGTITEHSTPSSERACPSTPEPTPVTTPYQPHATTPYQPLVEEAELSSGHATEDEVIANLNAQSPTPSREEMSRTPSIPSPTPSQEKVTNEVKLPTGIFKQRSLSKKGRGAESSPVEERRRRRKWFHKRSGSDIGERPLVSSGNAELAGVASEHSSPDLGASSGQRRAPFILRKSSSDGNLHAMLLRNHTPSDTGPELVAIQDCHALPLRRVVTGGTPLTFDLSNTSLPGHIIGGGAPSSASSDPTPSGHRPLRRSLTMDSPEPPLNGMLLLW